MSVNLTIEGEFVKVQTTGVNEAKEQYELLDPDTAREMAEQLEILAEAAEVSSR